jgi:hypothetical protein
MKRIERLTSQAGKLEFLILANDRDDKDGAEAAKAFLKKLSQEELEKLQKQGSPPLAPGRTFTIHTGKNAVSNIAYRWVEVGCRYRRDLQLRNRDGRSQNWQIVKAARDSNSIAEIPDYRGGSGTNVHLYVYSRECKDQNLTPKQRKDKQYEYFILVRAPEVDKKGNLVAKGSPRAVTGDYLTSVTRGGTPDLKPCINFELSKTGAALFGDLTGKNVPDRRSGSGAFYRDLAIILDGQVMSTPTINSRIEGKAQISGNFTVEEVDRLVAMLRSKPLPATLKREPLRIITVQPGEGK